MAVTTSLAPEFQPMITDNVVLSNEGGRWSVSLSGTVGRQRSAAPHDGERSGRQQAHAAR